MTWLKNLFGTKRGATPRATLELETLSARDMPSITLASGVITVTGDGSNDWVTVTRNTKGTASVYDDTVTVWRRHGAYGDPADVLFNPYSEVKTYKMYGTLLGTYFPTVKKVVANLKDGFNEFTNSTKLPSVVTGGAHADIFKGGSGDDWFDGKGGNDKLYGNAGNDTLYGGAGTDSLYGGTANDGLFGGAGTDSLTGNSGADRFLVRNTAFEIPFVSEPDVVTDHASADAMIVFKNRGVTFDSWGDVWAAGTWSENDIRAVDTALDALHRRMNNTRLLETAAGGTMTFYRLGDDITPSDYSAWNSGKSITLTDHSFDGGANWLAETVFHEIGHNWDAFPENLFIGGFRDLSGWEPMSFNAVLKVANGTHLMSKDGDWVYLKSADDNFTRDYAKTNPHEDFADSFAAYFMDYTDRAFVGGLAGGYGPVQDKLDWIDGYLNPFVS